MGRLNESKNTLASRGARVGRKTRTYSKIPTRNLKKEKRTYAEKLDGDKYSHRMGGGRGPILSTSNLSVTESTLFALDRLDPTRL